MYIFQIELCFVIRGKTGEVPNLVICDFALESVACKAPKWPVKVRLVKFQIWFIHGAPLI